MRGGCSCSRCSGSRSRSKAFTALRAASHFLLLAQEKVTKEKGPPDFPRRSLCERRALRCSESVGRRELGHPWPRTCAPFPAGFLRYSAGKTGTDERKAKSHSSLRSRQLLHPPFLSLRGIAALAECRAKRRRALAFALRSEIPHLARAEQRSQDREQGAHVRGHGWPSSRRPGHGEQRRAPRRLHRRGARLGCPSLWLLSLGQARESDSCPEGARKLLILILILILKRVSKRPVPTDQNRPTRFRLRPSARLATRPPSAPARAAPTRPECRPPSPAPAARPGCRGCRGSARRHRRSG
jgi:hypothetical protein